MLDNLFTPTHLLIILAIALLIFGPSKLPGLGKGLGEALRGFKDGIKGEPDAAKQDNTAARTDATTPTPQTK
jgi:sec-independent protein translocase protein TatA